MIVSILYFTENFGMCGEHYQTPFYNLYAVYVGSSFAYELAEEQLSFMNWVLD